MLGNLLSLLYPKACLGCGFLGTYLCSNCQDKISVYKTGFCSECGRASVHGLTHIGCAKRDSLHGLICLFEYKDPLKKIIHQIKYRFSSNVGEALVPLLSKTRFPAVLKEYNLVPVPLHTLRENWRGFNQSLLLGEKVSQEFGLKMQKDWLSRAIFEKSQVKLDLEQRKKNLKAAFEAKTAVEGKNIVLFDDIWTTGTTLREATKALKKSHADKVWGLCLATSHKVH